MILADLSLLRDRDIHVTCNFNLPIENKEIVVIPDFNLTLRPLLPPTPCATPFWIGECGFSSTKKKMLCQLEKITGNAPESDIAMMISIREKGNRLQKKEPLPELSPSAFRPTTIPEAGSLVPVVINGITWLHVKSITFHVFLRQADGTFSFKKEGTSYAEGVSHLLIQQSFY